MVESIGLGSLQQISRLNVPVFYSVQVAHTKRRGRTGKSDDIILDEMAIYEKGLQKNIQEYIFTIDVLLHDVVNQFLQYITVNLLNGDVLEGNKDIFAVISVTSFIYFMQV